MDTDRERHRAKETANTICFIMHKKEQSTSRGTKNQHQQRNKEPAPAEEQITSKGKKNQHQQKNREPAPVEDQRSNR
ncbi:hypothetical protein ES332_D05G361300v1 [Gossypium tomentosum]|uniref:Uncharacterized protein n=1 Tax=Gossypium tomentosum TaxID=34277 RepID=A0A5D2L3Z9_GOSTO|nr:hypothetical protein ES332_D05G361300v1 [Gossypium tomentosum]